MTAQALFDANFNPQKSISAASILRDADTTATAPQTEENKRWNTLWKEVETKYFEQNFTEALALLQQIQVLDPTGEYASETFYYAGLLHLQSGDAEQALNDFKKVVVGHTEDRDWYSALALLALDRKAEAKLSLEKIVESKYPRQKEAAKILQHL
ncbi:MAG: hypothetical protein IPM82_29830 [Saprospiraceae bacterium]|nr:hypothetical protein [Saprospiraceae bacterium]